MHDLTRPGGLADMPRRRNISVHNAVEAAPQAADWLDSGELFPEVYAELCRIASAIRRSDRGATVSTRTLVHEVWLKLSKSETRVSSPTHLKCVVARAMHNYLVDRVRRRRAVKNGSDFVRVTWDDIAEGPMSYETMITFADALAELEEKDPRKARLAELHVYFGCTAQEAADALHISVQTANRDWKFAKAWLAARIGRRSDRTMAEGA